MSKGPTNETNRPPVRLRLPQINPQELKMVRIALRRKDVPQDTIYTGTLIRNLDDPGSLILHKPGEGLKPIFDREDIIVNLDFDERIVVATDTLKSSKPEERENSNSKNRRSRSRSRQRSLNRDRYSRSKTKSNDRIGHNSTAYVKENSPKKPDSGHHRTVDEHTNRTDKSHTTDSESHTSSGVKSRRRSASKDRQRSSSRDREHSKLYRKKSPKSESYRARNRESERTRRHTPSPSRYDSTYRKYSKSPTNNRETTKRSRPPYSKSQERRSRSPHRDRDPKYRTYRKRSMSPYSWEGYESATQREYRQYRRDPPINQRIPIPPYQMPPNFGPLWPIYEPLRYMVPENYIPAPPPRIPGNMIVRPRMPPRQLPIYNNRPIPKVKTSSNVPASTVSIPTPSSTPSLTTTNVTANTTEEAG